MHNWFDQFVKEVLHEAFDPLGTAQQEVEISTDAQRIDFFFVPGPKSGSGQAGEAGSPQAPVPIWEGAAEVEVAEVPPIFKRMARTAYLLEHYRRSPNVRGVRGCLRSRGASRASWSRRAWPGQPARPAGTGRHIRERGFDKKYYVDLVLALVREHGPVTRKDVDDLLLSKLPDRMNEKQKQSKVHNLLQDLRRDGRIANVGSRADPRWVLASPPPNGEPL